jgi:hypothetical protein
MKGRSHRTYGILGAAVVGAALLGTGAQAAERPDDRAGMLGVGATQAVAVPDAFERAFIRSTAAATVPDAFERAAAGAAAATPDVFERAVARAVSEPVPLRPDDRAAPRGPGAAASGSVTGASAVAGSDAAWNETLVGIAGGLAILALGAMAALWLRTRRMILR